jgi:Domain of unknown function (DUF4129)
MLQISKTHRRSVAGVIVLLAGLFVCPANVAAIPLTEYEQRLIQAINDLTKLAHVDQDWDEADFEKRVLQTVDSIHTALPEHQTVETDGDVCNVDNSSLHKSLEDLKKLPPGEQYQKIEQITQTLKALEARIIERRTATKPGESKDQAKSKLESILARPEYVTEQRGPNALTRLLRDFFRWLESLFPKRRNVDPGRVDLISLIAQILVVGVALAVLAYVAKVLSARFGRTRRTKRPRKKEARIVLGERLEPEATATDLLSQAEALARRGDLRAAIRKAYIALLVELGDRKMISLAQHKTNRDYLNSVRSIPPLHSTMRGLTESFERHWYGFEETTPDDWQDFRAGYVAALQAES